MYPEIRLLALADKSLNPNAGHLDIFHKVRVAKGSEITPSIVCRALMTAGWKFGNSKLVAP